MFVPSLSTSDDWPQPTGTTLIRMPDGVPLATDLYLPHGGQASSPVVLIRTPYGKRSADSPVLLCALRLREAGFAVVVQDARGLGDSKGEAIPFIHEISDAGHTLDWIDRQPWANGKVASWGNSYYGLTAWSAAATRHPSLCALVSRVTSTQPQQLASHNGVFLLGPMVEWIRTTWDKQPAAADSIDWSTRPLQRLISDRAHATLLRPYPALRRTAAALWSALGSLPTLHWTGWFDLFTTRQMQEWRVAAHAGTRQYLIATATDHMDDRFIFSGRQADHLTDPAAREAWLDRTLDPVISFLWSQFRGTPSRAFPIRWELAGAGLRDAAVWPPKGAIPRSFALVPNADGQGHRLQPRQARRVHTLCWTHDPEHLVPTTDHDWWRPLLDPGDAKMLAARDDVLTFTADSGTQPIDFAGPVCLRLSVWSSTSVYHLVITLCDVAPDGVSRILLQTPQRVASTGILQQITLGELGYRQPAGHRLRLHIASSCFPLYAPQSGGPDDPLFTESFRPSHQTLDLRGCELIVTILRKTRTGPAPTYGGSSMV